jgi:hypothetical protein
MQLRTGGSLTHSDFTRSVGHEKRVACATPAGKFVMKSSPGTRYLTLIAPFPSVQKGTQELERHVLGPVHRRRLWILHFDPVAQRTRPIPTVPSLRN